MSRPNEWTSEDIEQMKAGFLQGETIKIIARKLGRTPTALNKALSRFGIRPIRKSTAVSHATYLRWKQAPLKPLAKTKDKTLTNSLFHTCFKKADQTSPLGTLPSENLSSKIRQESFLEQRKTPREQEEKWVNFSKVVDFLLRQGHSLRPVNPELGTYQLDRHVVNREHLLLLANRLRLEENKPIFLVNEVTW